MYTAFMVMSLRTTYQGPPESGTPFRCPMVWNQKPAGVAVELEKVDGLSTHTQLHQIPLSAMPFRCRGVEREPEARSQCTHRA